VNTANDEEIMVKVKQGDLDALTPLFDKYHLKLYNFFLRLTSDRETSRDLTQNVFSRIIQYRHTFNPQYKFRTWMYQMARNIHIDHYNKNKYLVSDMEMQTKDALEEMETMQKHNTLHEALNLLSVEQREIIELSRFQDLKYEDISRITGNTVGAVRVKVHRAINKLKDVYFQIA